MSPAPIPDPTAASGRRCTVNQKVIALEGGVSRSTVAAILAGGELASRYSEETRTKVLDAAARLNYQPSRAAQEMRKRRSNLMAIVHFGAGLEVVHKVNLAISGAVQAKGYNYLTIDMNCHGRSVDRTLTEIIRSRVEGVIISHIQDVIEESHIEILRRAGIPVVSINGSCRQHVPLIFNNSRDAFYQLTEHLLEQGHRSLLVPISAASHLPPDRHYPAVDRCIGFRDALAGRGRCLTVSEQEFFKVWPKIRKENEIIGIIIEQERKLYKMLASPMYTFCKNLFGTKKRPDAILCSNDFFAMEAIAAALEYDIRIPGDLAITGYDNDRMGAFPAFGLTTAEQDIEGICSKAVEVLQEMINDPSVVPADSAFPSTLFLRTSSLKRT